MKQTEFHLKINRITGLSLIINTCNGENITDIPLAQRPHARVHSSTSHTLEVHDQTTYIKERHTRYNSWIT